MENEEMNVAVVAWGRMNPPTIGHRKLVNAVKKFAEENNGQPFVYLSHTVDKKNECKNPLPYDLKIKYAQYAFGDCVTESDAKTVIQVLHELYEKGFTDIIYVGGEDRIGGDEDITEMIGKYNGNQNVKPEMYYNFESIQFKNAGHRDDNSSNLEEKASASFARALVKSADFEMFKKIVPFDEETASDMYDDLRDAMGLD